MKGELLKLRRIIWSLLLVLVFFVSVGFVFGLFAEKETSMPDIEFSEDLWNFGTVIHGDKVTHVFEVKNLGETVLIINRVRPSCGCTAALLSSSQVSPGGSAQIEVTFNSSGFKGKVNKYIYVESNDPDEPRKKLTITAVVEVPPSPAIHLEQNGWDFGLITKGERVTFILPIQNTGERELEIIKLRTSTYCTAKLISAASIPAGETGEISLSYDSSERKGLVREYLYIDSNDPFRKTLSFSITGYVREPRSELSIFPIFINFGSIQPGKDYTATIQLENWAKRNIRIIKIESASKFFTVIPSSVEISSGEEVEIDVTLNPIQKTGRVEDYLYITIALPVEGVVK